MRFRQLISGFVIQEFLRSIHTSRHLGTNQLVDDCIGD